MICQQIRQPRKKGHVETENLDRPNATNKIESVTHKLPKTQVQVQMVSLANSTNTES